MTKLLTIDEVAEILRRSPGQIRWMRHNNTGPNSAKIGGRIFFREEDVNDFIEKSFTDDERSHA